MGTAISWLLTLTFLFTGCTDPSMSYIETAEPDNQYSAEQSMADQSDIDKAEEAEEQQNIEESETDELGYDPQQYTYYCKVEDCPGHNIYGISSSDELPVCEPKTFTIDMTFVGDCMLATYKGKYYEGSFSWYAANYPNTYFFEKVQDTFANDDFTIVNLENVLTDNNLSEVWKDHSPAYWYKAPTSNANILTASSIEAVSLANNHFGDYGTQGRTDTMAAVEAVGLPYGTNDQTIYLEKDGFTIAVICHGLWSERQASQIIPRIQEASEKSDYQIVFYHGGTERIHSPEQWKIRASRSLVDAGADLVIGNHPHVLQPMEMYNGVRIIYSLGNFCFGGSRSPENRTVMYTLQLTINKDGNTVGEVTDNIIPCYVYTGSTNNWQPAPITDETEKQNVIDFMNWKRETPF